ncbi:ABC transporter permease [Luteibacter sp. PPL554]
MLVYYVELAARSLRRTPVVTAFMVLAVGLGIGASMTMLTLVHVMQRDPVPGHSSELFYPQVEPRSATARTKDAEPPSQLTWIDATNLMRSRPDIEQALMVGGKVAVRPPQGQGMAFYAQARYTSGAFFHLFSVPFRHGGAWSREDDDMRAPVAVISRTLADRLFGDADPVGRSLRLEDTSLRIVGVMDTWQPSVQFYDLAPGGYRHADEVFVPLGTARQRALPTEGSIACWGSPDLDHLETTTCTWTQLWVRLRDAGERRDYLDFLRRYSLEQKAAGRFEREPNVRLRNLPEWLAYNRVVPGDVRLQTLLALGFLMVCLVNTVTLMLVRYQRRREEYGVRRALGAPHRAIFAQLIVESGLVGACGGAAGILLAVAGLWLVRSQPADYAHLASLDVGLLIATPLAATVLTILAGVFPAWRACTITPAHVLKLQ